MSGKFTDTKYTQTIDSLVKANKSKLNNPYYIFTDKKPTKVIYYHQNKEMTTLDEAAKINYAHVGKQSAIKFNKITDFFLYGLEKITIDMDVSDYGAEANAISGDAIVLPNTIEPYVGDFFSINHIKERLLFKVNNVTPDTLDTGANIYRLEYQLELTSAIPQIEEQVEKTYKFIVNNIGTNFNTIIRDSDYDLIEKLESLQADLINYYNGIFFNGRVQTYVYNYDGWHMYDPYMIEFLRRTEIMGSGSDYTYIAHQTAVEKTFSYNYGRTIFSCLEDQSMTDLENRIMATADMITDPSSLFFPRIEDYYSIRYVDDSPYKTRLAILDQDVIEHIKSNTLYGNGSNFYPYNIVISYLNKSENYINDSIIDMIHSIDYNDNIMIFYLIPMILFIIDRYIKSNILSIK